MSDDVNDINPIGHGHLLREPVWRLSLRPYHLALDWTVPASVPDTLGGGFVTGFNIYRCGPGSGGCTPSSLIATVPANQYSYADTSVQSGQTYCYTVTYLHDDCQGGLTESPLSNIACGQICTNGCPQPEILITGNNAGSGPIQTCGFTDGALVNSFVSEGANVYKANGHGLATYQTSAVINIYYTELGVNSYGDGEIYICSYGTDGSGATIDSGTLPGPDPRAGAVSGWTNGIQDLALHFDSATGLNELFVLSSCNYWQPFVNNLNANTLADCEAYVNRLAYIWTNYSSGKLIISAGSGGYGDTNYYLDAFVDSYPAETSNNLVAAGALFDSIISHADGGAPITNGVNMAGYVSMGFYSLFDDPFYPVDGRLQWGGNSRWWIMVTGNSFSGIRGGVMVKTTLPNILLQTLLVEQIILVLQWVTFAIPENLGAVIKMMLQFIFRSGNPGKILPFARGHLAKHLSFKPSVIRS